MSTRDMNDEYLTQTIANLDDATATRVVQTIVGARRHAGESTTEWTPDLGPALQKEFELPAATTPTPPGDLARQTLLLLCQDERYREPILTLITNPPAERTRFVLEPLGGTLLITAALFALQSHIKIERDKDGRWTFEFIKDPSKNAIISPLIEKLVALISGGPPTP